MGLGEGQLGPGQGVGLGAVRQLHPFPYEIAYEDPQNNRFSLPNHAVIAKITW